MHSNNKEIYIQREEEVLQKRYEAILFLDFNKPIESMELFQQCLALDSTNLETHNELGLIFYLRLNNYTESLYHYKQALASNDTLFFLHYQYALVLSTMGEHTQACERYKKAIECDGDVYFTIQSYIALAEIYIQSGYEDREIAELYDQAIACAKEYFLAYYHKAVWLFYKKRYKEALETVYLSLEYNSYFPKAYYLLSSIYARMEDWLQAHSNAEKAVRYAEGHPLYSMWCEKIQVVCDRYLEYTKDICSVGSFLSALQDIEAYDTMNRIVKEYQEANVQTPSFYNDLQIAHARVLFSCGSYEEALACIQSVCNLAIEAEEKIVIQSLQGAIYEAMQEYMYAGECYAECYSLSTDVGLQYIYAYRAGCLYKQAESLEQARIWLHRAYTVNTESYDALYEYSRVLFMSEMIREMMEVLATLRTFAIQKEYIFKECVEMLYTVHAYAECIRWCERWKQYNPSNYLLYYYSAYARYARQYFLDAVENARCACLLSPSNVLCKEALTVLEEAVQTTQNNENHEDARTLL